MYGVFDKFWFWTIDYAMGFGNQVNLKDGLFNFMDTFGSLWHGFHFIWIIALSGFGVLFIHPRLKNDFRSLFTLLFLIFSFLSICPGLLFRPHYFVTLLPAVSILFGLSIDYLWEMSKFNKRQILKYISCSLLIISITFGIISQYDYFFILSPTEIIKKAYNINPFPESVPIGEYIKANSNDGDKIAILGSEPQICFYANRHSATGHITTYALMENHKYNLLMQKEMISDIESAMPKYFIYVNISTSWLMHDYSENYIFNWVDPFLLKNKYQLKGIVDIFNDRTIYKWDSEVYNYEAKSPYHVLIFRRNG